MCSNDGLQLLLQVVVVPVRLRYGAGRWPVHAPDGCGASLAELDAEPEGFSVRRRGRGRCCSDLAGLKGVFHIDGDAASSLLTTNLPISPEDAVPGQGDEAVRGARFEVGFGEADDVGISLLQLSSDVGQLREERLHVQKFELDAGDRLGCRRVCSPRR